ncbi:GNAT family N-acetyltransferase [Candidatus Parvarchaeota archaeon]|jgi:GNAT superfamily N-acetyltransferase|nr:GNAT family N-acetyltransferase [Candidatus Parvarchaeota archaeon]
MIVSVGGKETFRLKSEDPAKLGKKILDEIVDFTVKTFQNGMKESEVMDHIKDNDLFLVLYKDNKAIGFAGSKYSHTENDENRHAYFSAAVVSSKFQGRKLYSELVKTRIEEALGRGFNTITTRTQNPLVEFTIRNELDMYRINYSVNRQLIPGVFGRKLTEKFQTCKEEFINEEYRKLDLEKGDGYYLTFNLNRYKRDKPKENGGINL